MACIGHESDGLARSTAPACHDPCCLGGPADSARTASGRGHEDAQGKEVERWLFMGSPWLGFSDLVQGCNTRATANCAALCPTASKPGHRLRGFCLGGGAALSDVEPDVRRTSDHGASSPSRKATAAVPIHHDCVCASR